jgi:hypothetical protein
VGDRPLLREGHPVLAGAQGDPGPVMTGAHTGRVRPFQ